MDVNRKAAYHALLEIESKGAYSNLAAAAAIRKYRPDDEAFVRTLIYGALENQIYLDYRLSRLVRSGLSKVRRPALILLRLGAYQISFLNSVPDYAAINESVSMTRRYCRGLEGFVNGVLRAYARGEGNELPDFEKEPERYLAVKYSYAEDITAMWLAMFGPERTRSLMEAGNRVPELTVRVNTLKCDAGTLSEKLKSEGASLRPISVKEPHGSRLSGLSLHAEGSGILRSEAFRDGWFYVQDAASSAAVAALNPKPGETVIDLCAAPGGKSFAAAMMMNNTGRILSCDIYEHKLELIRSTSARLGTGIIEPVLRDARDAGSEYDGMADAIIADVPCSGLGVVRRRPEMKLRAKRENIRKLSALQKEILDHGARLVKEGGRLMYSTCTISDAENAQVKDAFLSSHPEFRVMEENLFLPDEDPCDGFYYCVMRKNR